MMIKEQVSKLLPKGIHLMDVKENSRGRSVRLIIDSENAIDLQKTAEIATLVNESGILDEPFPSGCNLEVSSPGLSAPLTESFQFKKHIGRTLKLCINKDGKQNHLQAKLVQADDDEIQFVSGNTDPETVGYADIIEAKIKITFH